jgi:hypothetical protein
MNEEADRFLRALSGELPEDERMITCGFVGDPFTVGPTAWRPKPWRAGREIVLSDRCNAYVTVASFRRAGDGSFRRRTETFAGGLALMVDDVGTKVAPEIVSHVQPSAIVETSPGNHQWWYFLREPERDMGRFDGVIRAFISGSLLGADPGMSGVTRVGRLPGFVNAKPKYVTPESPDGFRVRLLGMDENIRYSIDELLERFKLSINGRRIIREQLATDEAIERNRAFGGVFKFLDQRTMLKKSEPDPSGWTEMTCPWLDDHTGRSDTGAAIREPAPENDYYGAFRCHHGHCADKGWAELTEWVNELAAEELSNANMGATNAE